MKRSHESTDQDNGKKKKCKTFDFNAHPKRKIALAFYYYGWDYEGLVQQKHTDNTVEEHLMKAFLKTKLVEDWKMCDLSRCGRTDKGVSGFRQVMACVVRSSDPDGDGAFWPEETSETIKSSYQSSGELPYAKMLNGCLPHSIRVMCWAPVEKTFNARHSCTRRTYKYSMPRADLDVEAMKLASSYLIGLHDFRNFCQIDMNEARVKMSYIREIYDINLSVIGDSTDKLTLIEVTVIGSGFLWHMIRYIVTILHEIGSGHEKPELVNELLDVASNSSRPQYSLAADTPLCLFDCSYENSSLDWKYDQDVQQRNLGLLQKQWAELQTKSRILENMMEKVSSEPLEMEENIVNQGLKEFTQAHPWPRNYIPIMNRKLCDSLEDKQAKLQRKVNDAQPPVV